MILPIPNYESLYNITTDGKIYSLRTGKEVAQHINHNGYMRVNLWKNGGRKNFRVHRLVAETFLTNPKNKPEVNHKDGDRQNNNVRNLEWVTESENAKHANARRLGKNNQPTSLYPKCDWKFCRQNGTLFPLIEWPIPKWTYTGKKKKKADMEINLNVCPTHAKEDVSLFLDDDQWHKLTNALSVRKQPIPKREDLRMNFKALEDRRYA